MRRSLQLLLLTLLVVVLAVSGCAPVGRQAPGQPTGQAGAAAAEPATSPVATGQAGTASAPTGSATPRAGGTLRYGLTLPVSGIDPHIHASSELGIALSSVYDELVAQDRQGGFHPYLATSWTISDDGKTYTFKLRQDVKFHDGTPFNADAVVRNLQRVTDPKTRSQKAVFLLGPFDHARAVDPYTVEIVLKQPYPPLLDALSQVYLGMASPAALDKWGDQYQLHQVGTGPFRFVSFQERQSLVIERNPDYNWAPEIRAHQGPAYLDRIEFSFYGDAATRLPALLSGQADVMGELPPNDAAQMPPAPGYKVPGATDASKLKTQNFQLYPIPVPGQSVQFFLNTTLPPLDDLRVRQALLYGTDRAGLVKAVFGPTSPVAQGSLTAVTRGYSVDTTYTWDAQKAQSLLKEAGWAPGPDGILVKNGQPLVLKGILQSWGDLTQVGTIVQAQWKALGIDLRLEQMTYPAALDAGHNNTHHLLPFSISFTDPSQLSTFFSSQGQMNWSHVKNSALDDALNQANSIDDWSRRAPLYAQAQGIIMTDALILPIRDPVNLNAASVRVQGLTYDVQGWFPVLYDVWLR